MNVLCIDASLTSTGWALFKAGRLKSFGKVNSKERGTERIVDIAEAIDALLGDVDYVVMEGGFSRLANLKTGLELAELRGALKYKIGKRQVEYIEAAPQTAKKLLVGTGRATKEEVFAKLQEKYKNSKTFAKIGPFSDKPGKNKTSDIYDAISLYEVFNKSIEQTK